jgi:hypothetical protein
LLNILLLLLKWLGAFWMVRFLHISSCYLSQKQKNVFVITLVKKKEKKKNISFASVKNKFTLVTKKKTKKNIPPYLFKKRKHSTW